MKRLFPMLFVLVLCVFSINGYAVEVSYLFTGQVSILSCPPEIDPATLPWEIGDSFSGILTYDTDIPDTDARTDVGVYFLPPPSEILVSINGLNFVTKFDNNTDLRPFLYAFTDIRDFDPRHLLDFYGVNTDIPVPFEDWDFVAVRLTFMDNTATALTSDQLPSNIDLNRWDYKTLLVGPFLDDWGVIFGGTLQTLEPIPTTPQESIEFLLDEVLEVVDPDISPSNNPRVLVNLLNIAIKSLDDETLIPAIQALYRSIRPALHVFTTKGITDPAYYDYRDTIFDILDIIDDNWQEYINP